MVARAVTDLPDPMDMADSPSKASADDLIAQMADQAIDQLIADAEKGTPRPRTPERSAEALIGAPIETRPDPLPSAASSALPETPHIATVADLPTDVAPTDQPFSHHALEIEPEVAPTTDLSPGAAKDIHSYHVDETTPPERVVMARDRQALLGDAPAATRTSQSGVLLTPLKWLNAPFASLSDTTRDRIGQLAVVTLINAMAFILYYVLFRR